MFELFKRKQQKRFDENYNQIVKEYNKLIELTKNSNTNNDGKDFVEKNKS